jgi:hypothetical protein
VAVYETDEFRVGKQTCRGRPTPTDPFHATIVTADQIDSFLGTGSVEERVAHLRGLRDLGLLVHNRGRLTQKVRARDGRVRGYVFRCRPDEVPRRKRRARRPAQRIATW